jgi:nitroreductase
MAEIELFESIYSARALRRFKPDPVPNEIIGRILDAAIRAPSGSNAQEWLFVVVKDPEQRRRIGEIYRRASEVLLQIYAHRPRAAHITGKQLDLLMKSVTYLFEHMGEAPVLLVACLRSTPPPPPEAITPEIEAALRPADRTSGASIYPAVQNIILACRAFGLGTALTTIHTYFEEDVKAALGLPKDVRTYALLPIGYPRDKFGPVKRRPLSEVACLDHYGNPWPT